MTQHASLSPERWAAFGLDRQILMIANEMQRARGLFRPDDRDRLRNTLERVLRLVDLTVANPLPFGLLRELLRWRGLVAEAYLSPAPDPDGFVEVFRSLLLLHPVAARQIPFLLPPQGVAAGVRNR